MSTALRMKRSVSHGTKLFFPVVNTEDCEDAVKWALDNVYKLGDTLYFYHVVPYSQAAYSGVFLPPSNEEVERKVKIAEDALKSRLEPVCRKAGVPFQLEVVRSGGDAEGIGELCCSRAMEVGSRAMLLCPHDKGRAVRFFVGSVTECCIKNSAVPVVVVHQQGSNGKQRVESSALLSALAETDD